MGLNITSKMVGIVLLVGFVVGWILALAGIARGEDLCVKAASSGGGGGGGGGSGGHSSKGSADSDSDSLDLSAADKAALAAAFAGRRLSMTAFSTFSETQGRALLQSAVSDCGMSLSLWWWSTFFELLCIVLAALLLFNVPGFIRKFQQVTITFFSIATVLLCFQATAFVTSAYSIQAGGGDAYAAASVASAGTVVLLLCNFLWIIVNQSDIVDCQVHSISVTPK